MADYQFQGADQVPIILDTLMTALTDALGCTTRGVPPRMVTTYGSAATLDCPEMGWVRVVNMFPSTRTGGQQDMLPTRMAEVVRWYVQVELGVNRCVTTVESSNGQPLLPTPTQIAANTATLTEDARALRAVALLLPERARRDMNISAWTPTPADGGSMGGTINLSLWFTDCTPIQA